MRMLGYLMGTERLAGGWLIPSSAAMGSWRPWGPLGLRGSEQGTARRAGQVAGGDVLWTLGLGACGPEGCELTASPLGPRGPGPPLAPFTPELPGAPLLP